MKEDVMDRACGSHGLDDKCFQNFWLENLKGGNLLEDLDIDMRMSEWMLKRKVGRVWT
jgi:hypothetical protein